MASDTPEDVYQRLDSLERRTCWVCFATEEDDPTQKWVKPCRCKGTTKWVHNFCLQRWFDEKQHGNPTVQVFCPQCNTEYAITYPALGCVHIFLDAYNAVIDKFCPVMTGAVVVGVFYWGAVTVGGLTVWQVMGLGVREGWQLFGMQDWYVLLVGLPVIPCALFLTRLIRWEDWALEVWREQSRKWWILRKMVGDQDISEEVHPIRLPIQTDSQIEFVNMTRLICGALMLPTVATACGKVFFGGVESPLKRTLMGGLAWLCVKGVVRMYHKQQQYVRLARREIMDFHEEPESSSL